MSKVSEAIRLRIAAANYRMAAIEGNALGYPDAENTHRADGLEDKAAALLDPDEPVTFTAAGEVVTRHQLRSEARIVCTPGIAAIEAGEARINLLDKAHVLAMGLDLAEEVGATDSRQKMLAHQLALMHTKIFELMNAPETNATPLNKPD